MTVEPTKTEIGASKPVTWSTLEPEKNAAFSASVVVPRAAG